MMFVIVRTTDGCYVCPPGRSRSYSPRLQNAILFRFLSDASRFGVCEENERIMSLDDLVHVQPHEYRDPDVGRFLPADEDDETFPGNPDPDRDPGPRVPIPGRKMPR